MNELQYAFAVARIRYNEMKLLKDKDFEQLISASDIDEALGKLGETGYQATQYGDLKDVFNKEAMKAWSLLLEIAPDNSLLDVFGVLNAFHNLKSALKSRVSGSDSGPYYLLPSCVEISLIDEAVGKNDFSILPEYMCQVAQISYRIMTENADGQLGEAYIDKAALDIFKKFAEKTDCPEVIRVANFKCAAADIKIAYRGCLTGKNKEFYDASLCPCEQFDITLLVSAALEGKEELLDYLKTTSYKDAAGLLAGDFVAFEKWCDDSVMDIIRTAKAEPFGFAPLAAYWIAKETELKNVRMIMSAKQNGFSEDSIFERMRKLYV